MIISFFNFNRPFLGHLLNYKKIFLLFLLNVPIDKFRNILLSLSHSFPANTNFLTTLHNHTTQSKASTFFHSNKQTYLILFSLMLPKKETLYSPF